MAVSQERTYRNMAQVSANLNGRTEYCNVKESQTRSRAFFEGEKEEKPQGDAEGPTVHTREVSREGANGPSYDEEKKPQIPFQGENKLGGRSSERMLTVY